MDIIYIYLYILYALHKAEEDFLGQGRRPVKNDADKRSNEEVNMIKMQLYT